MQTIHKILAALIKERIDAGIDQVIQKLQYGFRRGRSTAHAMFVARRLQDISGKQGSNVVLVLLDWEEAFDEVDQKRLIQALELQRTHKPA